MTNRKTEQGAWAKVDWIVVSRYRRSNSAQVGALEVQVEQGGTGWPGTSDKRFSLEGYSHGEGGSLEIQEDRLFAPGMLGSEYLGKRVLSA